MPTEKDVRKMWTEDSTYNPNTNTKYNTNTNTNTNTNANANAISGAKGISIVKGIVTSWDGVDNVDTSMILTTLKSWCDKFVGVGNGMAANDLPNSNDGSGVKITFFLTDECELRITLEDTHKNDDDSSSSKYYQLVSSLVLTSSITNDDEMLVTRATERLLEKLSKEMDSYQFIKIAQDNDNIDVSDKGYVDEDDVDEAFDAIKSASFVPSSSSSSSSSVPKRDPAIVQKAKDVGVKLENFEGRGLEEQAMKELNDMISNSKKSGFLATIKAAEATAAINSSSTDTTDGTASRTTSIGDLFKEGVTISEDTLKQMLERYDGNGDDLSKPQTKFPINLKVLLSSLLSSLSSLS